MTSAPSSLATSLAPAAPSAPDTQVPARQNPTPEQQAHLDRLPKSFRKVKDAADQNGWKVGARARFLKQYGEEVSTPRFPRPSPEIWI